MTLITIDTENPRDCKALELAAKAEGWSRLADNWYRMPSQDGRRVYDVASDYCSCEDHRSGARCKHMRAVAIFEALSNVSARLPRQAPASVEGLDRILSTRPLLYETDHRGES